MRHTVTAALIGASLALASPARAAGCESAAQVTSDLWKKYGETLSEVAKEKGGTAESAATVAATAEKMIAKWNSLAGNSWAKVGARQLSYTAANSGTVESIGDRAWVSAHPASGAITVSFKKTDGSGTAEVSVCKVDKNNKATMVKQFTVDKNDKDGKSWSVPISDAKGNYITVIVDGKNVLKKVGYSFTAK